MQNISEHDMAILTPLWTRLGEADYNGWTIQFLFSKFKKSYEGFFWSLNHQSVRDVEVKVSFVKECRPFNLLNNRSRQSMFASHHGVNIASSAHCPSVGKGQLCWLIFRRSQESVNGRSYGNDSKAIFSYSWRFSSYHSSSCFSIINSVQGIFIILQVIIIISKRRRFWSLGCFRTWCQQSRSRLTNRRAVQCIQCCVVLLCRRTRVPLVADICQHCTVVVIVGSLVWDIRSTTEAPDRGCWRRRWWREKQMKVRWGNRGRPMNVDWPSCWVDHRLQASWQTEPCPVYM